MNNDYFDMLEDWKLLPAYKLEPRIDSLVGFALQNVKVSDDLLGVQKRVLIPELPIRKGTVKKEYEGTRSQNRSYKVDFYMRGQKDENLFIEFKSDTRSIRDEQIEYLKKSEEVRMKEIVEGVLKLSKSTRQKPKYAHLLSKLEEAGLIDSQHRSKIDDEDIKIVFIQPHIVKDEIQDEIIQVLAFNALAKSIRVGFSDESLMTSLANSLDAWGIG